MKKINSFTKICLLITSIFLFSCEQPANPPKEPLAPSTISTEQINANIKKSGIAKDVELQTTIQNVSYKLILSASSGTFNASKNERAANNSCSGSFFYKDSYVFINIEDDSTFLKIFVDKVLDEMNRQAVKAKSEIENSTLIISSTKTSTSITSDDYTNAKTSFTEKVEDYLSGLTEEEPSTEEPPEEPPVEEPPIENPPEEPPVEDPPIENPPENQPEEPPVENPPTEDPFIDDPSVSQSLKESAEYKLLREVGFTHITGVDVPVEAGKYQPKTGEIVELFYIKGGMDPTTYTLNREKSTEGHLVYDASSYDICYGIEDTETWTGDEFSFDSKTKTLTHYHPSAFGHDVYEYSYIKVNEDGSMVLGRYKMDPAVGVPHDNIELEYEFDNTQVCDWDPSNKFEDAIWSDKSTDYMNISFKLANETKQEPEELPFIVNDTISPAL